MPPPPRFPTLHNMEYIADQVMSPKLYIPSQPNPMPPTKSDVN